MKLAIIGDCHLGASLKAGTRDPVTGMYSRLQDYGNTLRHAIRRSAENGCKYLVFTGDIFEHRSPHMQQQKMFSAALKYAVSLGFERIWICIGNHDQQRNSDTTTLAYLSELKLPNIVVVDDPQHVVLGNHTVYFYPYRDRRYLECATYADAIAKVDKQVRDMRAASSSAGTHLMIGHMAIEGTFFAEEEAELYVDNELMLLRSSFENYDLTIMGHVHSPGQISVSPPIFYVGSLEKRGAFEDHSKQFLIVDLDARTADWEALPCRRFFEFEIDVSGATHGADTMTKIEAALREKMPGTADSIVKLEIIIRADDLAHLDLDSVVRTCAEFEPAFVFPPVPVLRSNRAARTELKEEISETETWANYVGGLGLDEEFAKELIQVGSTIITEGEA